MDSQDMISQVHEQYINSQQVQEADNSFFQSLNDFPLLTKD